MMIILGAITDKASLASCLSSWVYGAHCFDLVFDGLDFGNFMWNSTKIAKTLKKLISGRSVWLSTKMNFLVLVDFVYRVLLIWIFGICFAWFNT